MTPLDSQRRRLRAAHFHRLAGDGELAACDSRAAPCGGSRRQRNGPTSSSSSRRRRRATAPAELIELCDEALAEVPDDDMRATRILAYRSFIRLFQADVRAGSGRCPGRARAGRAGRRSETARRGDSTGGARGSVGCRGDHSRSRRARGRARGASWGSRSSTTRARASRSPAILGGSGDIERAHAIFEELEQKATDRGDEPSRGQSRLAAEPDGVVHWGAGSGRSSTPWRRSRSPSRRRTPTSASSWAGSRH